MKDVAEVLVRHADRVTGVIPLSSLTVFNMYFDQKLFHRNHIADANAYSMLVGHGGNQHVVNCRSRFQG